MKISLYFIFYVVMILELLIFIMERDEATDQHMDDVRQMLTLSDSLAREFSHPLTISVPDTTPVSVYSGALGTAIGRSSDTARVELVPMGLWSDAERQEVAVAVYDGTGALVAEDRPGKRSTAAPKDLTLQLSVNRVTGNALLKIVVKKEGMYQFKATSSVTRSVPGYYPRIVRESVETKLRTLLGAEMLVKTAGQVGFIVHGKSDGKRLPPCKYCGQGPE